MQKRPHIIIMNPDQWRGDVMGHAGNPAAQTPHLDAWMREDAVSFSSAFCQNPVCTPSRCSFMTGWYPHVNGHRTMYHMLHEGRGEVSLLKVLKDSGYLVWWGGKNDLLPGQEGWEGHCDIHYRPQPEDYKRWGCHPREGTHGGDMAWRGKPGDDHFFSFLKGKLDTRGEPCYCDGDWANVLGAIDFLRSYQGDQPLCLYLPLQYPHPPYCVEEPWYSLIDRSALPPRIPAPDDWTGKPGILEQIYKNQGLQSWTEEKWDELRAVYYGMCARVDQQFHLLTEALRETNRYDDSAVFFFSDHGDFTGDYGLVEKTQNTMEDCLTRVPFLVKPPKEVPVIPGTRSALVELIDFPATVYDLAGVNPGYDHFGKSLLPLMADGAVTHRDAVFCEGGRRRGETQAMEGKSGGGVHDLYAPRVRVQWMEDPMYHTKAAMCRTQRHKYVKRLYEQDELYDLVEDPGEQVNRIDAPDCQDVLAELKERLATWYMETCDITPRENDERNFT